MSSSRYCPRAYCSVPEEFGRSTGLTFAPLAKMHIKTPQSAAERRRNLDNQIFPLLARVQHEHALAMRRLLKANGLTIKAYAESTASNPATLGRMLCGSSVMHQDVIERMDQMLGGLHLLIRIRATEERATGIGKQMLAVENGIGPSPGMATMPSGLYLAARLTDP
jgi:hypothetical protein